MLLAEGAVDLAAEPELALWDMAALAPIVTEAGGRHRRCHRRSVDRGTRSVRRRATGAKQPNPERR